MLLLRPSYAPSVVSLIDFPSLLHLGVIPGVPDDGSPDYFDDTLHSGLLTVGFTRVLAIIPPLQNGVGHNLPIFTFQVVFQARMAGNHSSWHDVARTVVSAGVNRVVGPGWYLYCSKMAAARQIFCRAACFLHVVVRSFVCPRSSYRQIS